MIPHIENPALYRDFFNLYQPHSISPFTVLHGDRASALLEESVETLKSQNRADMDSAQTITQIGSGEVQLISPAQASVERAKEGLKIDNKRKKSVKNIHSLIGLGKGKSKSKKSSKNKSTKKNSSKKKSKKSAKSTSKKGKVKKGSKKGKQKGKNKSRKGKKK